MAVDSKKYLAENVLNERQTVCFFSTCHVVLQAEQYGRSLIGH